MRKELGEQHFGNGLYVAGSEFLVTEYYPLADFVGHSSTLHLKLISDP